MTETLETIQSFWSTEEAYLAKNRLEANGIRSYLNDESVAMLGAYCIATGGVKLVVKGTDVRRAAAILDAECDTEGADSESLWSVRDKVDGVDAPLSVDQKADILEDTEDEEVDDDTPGPMTPLRTAGRGVILLLMAFPLLLVGVEILNFLKNALWNLWVGN